LWLPTKTALQGKDLNSSNTLLNVIKEKSWFSTRLYTAPKTNLPRTYLQSSMSSLVGCTDARKYKNKKDKVLSEPKTEDNVETVVRCVKACLQQDN
jgi:hypothetical protein